MAYLNKNAFNLKKRLMFHSAFIQTLRTGLLSCIV